MTFGQSTYHTSLFCPKYRGLTAPTTSDLFLFKIIVWKSTQNASPFSSGDLFPFLSTLIRLIFISGRSISKFFVYAADIVQSCHRRSTPATIFKLEFRIAFDSIIWAALDWILLAKGFPDLWIAWIKILNHSSQTAVLLNGILGRWI
jgi:hypothetical protein